MNIACLGAEAIHVEPVQEQRASIPGRRSLPYIRHVPFRSERPKYCVHVSRVERPIVEQQTGLSFCSQTRAFLFYSLLRREDIRVNNILTVFALGGLDIHQTEDIRDAFRNIRMVHKTHLALRVIDVAIKLTLLLETRPAEKEATDKPKGTRDNITEEVQETVHQEETNSAQGHGWLTVVVVLPGRRRAERGAYSSKVLFSRPLLVVPAPPSPTYELPLQWGCRRRKSGTRRR